MRIPLFFFLIICYTGLQVQAQQTNLARIHSFVDFTAAIGNQEGTTAFAYVRNWRLGKTKKLELGFGLRLTSYLGINKEFYTAPARFAWSSTVPFLGVFSGHEYQNVDTLTVQRPSTNSLNVSANVGYRFAKKWYAGLNIDLIGFTVGRTTSSTLVSNGSAIDEPVTKASSWNVLLTGDLDYGSLNSEFFVKYNISPRLNLKAVYEFLFIEYKTQSIHQTTPDGTEVYRFRNKANLLGLGLSYEL